MDTKYVLLLVYLAYVLIISLITFALYGIDKRKAQKGKYRIPEATLLIFSLIGGAIGGMLGMKKFRHKTKHWYFTAINVLGIAIILSIIICLLFVFKFVS